MNVLIEVSYIGWECTILQKGYFEINRRKFKENADQTAAFCALRWINKLRIDHHVSEIIKVKYNEIDITDLVKDLDHSFL